MFIFTRYTGAVVCFVGNARVSFASVILDPHDPEQLHAKFDLLRRNVPLPGASERPVLAQFCFVVAGCSRGPCLWDLAGVESAAFAEYFPDVPLAGFFSDREFGQNVLPETDPRVGKDGTRADRPTSRFPYTENAGNINNIAKFGTTTVFAVITVLE